MPLPQSGYQALRKGRVSQAGQIYFITKATQERVQTEWTASQRMAEGRLVQPGVPEIITESLDWLQKRGELLLLAYCLMPDHIHLLFQLGERTEVSPLINRFCSYTGLQVYKHTARGDLWFEGFHDHALRSDQEIEPIATYIEYNPVEAKLVGAVHDWEWSSIHWR